MAAGRHSGQHAGAACGLQEPWWGRPTSLPCRNRNLPRFAVRVSELSTTMFFGHKNLPRLAVVDPETALLTIMAQPPRENDSTNSEGLKRSSSPISLGSLFSSSSWGSRRRDEDPAKTRRRYSLERLVDVQLNPHFRNVFLRFSDHQQMVCLTAGNDADFESFSHLLCQYLPEATAGR